jgi:hypothetical protein
MRSGFSSEFLHSNLEMPLNGPFRYAKNPPLRRAAFNCMGTWETDGFFLMTWDLNKQKANYDQARLNLINHLSRYRIVFTSTNVKGEVRPRPKWEKWKNKFELLEFAEDPRA